MRLREAYKKNSIPQLYAMRKACRKLLGYYSGGVDFLTSCPLCTACADMKAEYATVLCDGEAGIKHWLLCPWKVMEGFSCGEYTVKRITGSPGIMGLRIRRDPRWTKIRIPQLKKWIKRFTQYIETREKSDGKH